MHLFTNNIKDRSPASSEQLPDHLRIPPADSHKDVKLLVLASGEVVKYADVKLRGTVKVRRHEDGDGDTNKPG